MSTEKLEHVLVKTAERLDMASEALTRIGAKQAGALINDLEMVHDLFWCSVIEVETAQRELRAFLKRVLDDGAAHSPVIHKWAVKTQGCLDTFDDHS